MLGAALAVVLGATGVADPPPVPDGIATLPPHFCPISVRAYALDGHAGEAVFALWSDRDAGTASGTLAVYVGDHRYSIGFVNVVAADERNTNVLPTPIVVQFPGLSHVDSAYVEALSAGDCPIHEPYVAADTSASIQRYEQSKGTIYPDWSGVWPAFLGQAAATPALTAPAGETVDAPACAKPYVAARATRAVSAVPPDGETFNGEVVFKADVEANGVLRAVRLEKSSHVRPVDRAALEAVARSQFAPQIYRCAPVSSDDLFIIKFAHETY